MNGRCVDLPHAVGTRNTCTGLAVSTVAYRPSTIRTNESDQTYTDRCVDIQLRRNNSRDSCENGIKPTIALRLQGGPRRKCARRIDQTAVVVARRRLCRHRRRQPLTDSARLVVDYFRLPPPRTGCDVVDGAVTSSGARAAGMGCGGRDGSTIPAVQRLFAASAHRTRLYVLPPGNVHRATQKNRNRFSSVCICFST